MTHIIVYIIYCFEIRYMKVLSIKCNIVLDNYQIYWILQ